MGTVNVLTNRCRCFAVQEPRSIKNSDTAIFKTSHSWKPAFGPAWLRLLTVKTEGLKDKKKLLLNKFLDVGFVKSEII